MKEHGQNSVLGSVQGEDGQKGSVSAADHSLLEALREGREDAFVSLVNLYNASLFRLAMMYLGDRSVAEEVVQETWIGLLESLDRFEERSSLKTWIFRILINSAKKRRGRERRSIPFSALWDPHEERGEPSVDPDRFLDTGHRWAQHWRAPPSDWSDLPGERVVSKETLDHVEGAIASLPPAQREVITLRDLQGWSATEVCNVLDLTETNQRVLLHRARTKVRRDLERYLTRDRKMR